MTPVEKLEAAISKLEGLRAEADNGWVIASWHDGTAIPRTWAESSESPRGGFTPVLSSNSNLELIVTLHRTIDAQIRLLRQALDWHAEEYVSYIGAAEIALADAILGEHP